MLRDSKSTVSVIALLSSLFSVSVCAHAQAQTAPEPVESVVVTGSRTITDIANSPTPIIAVNRDQLLATTPTTIADALFKLPQFANSASRQNAGGASGNGGGNYLNLRNFGQQRTLVLEDNMRVPSTNANGSVDISVLPQMLISRVDTVTGGASAVYGSDAITGVVNFVIDKNYNGVKYEANAGLSTYGDGLSDKFGIAAGTSLFGGRGHLEGEASFNHQDEVLKDARPQGQQNWGQYGNGTAGNPFTNIQQGRLNITSPNGNIICTNCSVNGQQFIGNDVIGAFDFGTPTTTNSVSIGGDGGYWGTGTALASTTRVIGFGRFSYDINDDTTFFAQFTGSQARVFNHFIPSQIDDQRGTNVYFKNNAFLPALAQAQLGNNGTFNTSGANSNTFKSWKWIGTNTPGNPQTPGQIFDPTRRTNSVQRNLTFSSGLSGKVFKDFDWTVHYTHGESRDSVTGINNGNNQFADAAHDAVFDGNTGHVVCYNDTAAAIALYGNIYPGCVPMNSFGPTAITTPAYNYWSRNTNAAITQKMDDVQADLAGNIFELPAGPVRAALSGEMRWLDYNVKSNASPNQTVNCYGLRLCSPTQSYWDNNTLGTVAASSNVWEFSGEVNVPILKDIPLVQSLSTDIAGRYTNYSISGAVQTWKVGLNWAINDDLRLRGTTSVDIRAPTLNDQYEPATQTSIGYTDLLTNYGNGLLRQQQGNPLLVPEVSRTYTAGLVYTPSYIPGLTMSVDYYQINLKNAISTINGDTPAVQQVCNASGGTSPYCALYVRPFPYTNTTPANYPSLLYALKLNSAFVRTEGEDYEVDYQFDMADVFDAVGGHVDLRGFVNVQPVLNAASFPGVQVQHNAGAGGSTPTQPGHASFLAGYSLNDWTVNYQFTWYSGFRKNGLYQTPLFYAQPRVASFNTSDITVAKKIAMGDGDAQLYVTVQNIVNARAPIVNGSNANPGVGTATPSGEDIMGRYFTVGIRGNF